ncbi:MAG TPA: hypothetical protein DCL44_08485 [Elusimicrobia bacterium]|nr:hypothetical protein [Elusimicrobiota bacterium]
MQKKCPLCNQTVSQTLYERITGIWKERRLQEKALKEEKRKLLAQQKENEKKLLLESKRLKLEQKTVIQNQVAAQTKRFDGQLARLEQQKNKIAEQANKRILAAAKNAEREGYRKGNKQMKDRLVESVKKEVEKATAKKERENIQIRRTLASTTEQMSTLKKQGQQAQDKIRNLEGQLKNRTTPQNEGLLYEDELLKALKKDFPKDKLTHTGKGGDILHEVIINGEAVGCIVYECKRVGHWNASHVEQTAKAKLTREADYAVLVTNAEKKGTSGFFVEKGVIVINPGGVLAIANILRDQIITIARLKLSKAQKEEAVENTLRYLEGPEFRNSIEIVIRKTQEMHEDLKKECKDHVKAWGKRHDMLKTIYINAAQVQTKTTALIAGKKNVAIDQPIPFPALEFEKVQGK